MMPSRSTPNLQQTSTRENKLYAYYDPSTVTRDDDSPPPAPPVRDSSSLKSVKYGPGHEKFPSWPVPSAAEAPQALRGPPSGGSHRSKSWTDHTNYPKEKVVTYTRPYMKRQHSAHTQQKLKTVMERCEKLPSEVFDSRYDKLNDRLYLPTLDRDGKQLGDVDYMVPSPPERDTCKPQLTQADLEEYARSYQDPSMGHFGQDKGLTEDFIKYARNYEDSFIGQKGSDLMQMHQKQLSYAQSEGYHSYVSSSDSTSTPFLDRLRRDSEAVATTQRSWEDDHDPKGRDSVVTTSSGSASSSETLKWHGSMSDVSVASSSCTHLASNKQLIAHSARVQTPQRHHSESVLYMGGGGGGGGAETQDGWKDKESRNNNANKLKLFPVNTYTVPESTSPNNNRINELEKQQKYSYLDPEKKHKIPDPTLKAIQKKALLSFYERHQQSSNKGNQNWRSEPQLAQSLQPTPQPPPRIKVQPSRRASSASDYASNNSSKRSSLASNREAKLAVPKHQHSNSCGSLSTDLLGPVIVGPSISLDDWVPERPPKNPHLRNVFPDLFQDQRVPSPDLPPPSPPTVLEDEVFHSDEPLPPPPSELETSDWQQEFQERLKESTTTNQAASPQVETRASGFTNSEGVNQVGLPENGLMEGSFHENGIPERGFHEKPVNYEKEMPQEKPFSERNYHPERSFHEKSERGVSERGKSERGFPTPERTKSERGSTERMVSERCVAVTERRTPERNLNEKSSEIPERYDRNLTKGTERVSPERRVTPEGILSRNSMERSENSGRNSSEWGNLIERGISERGIAERNMTERGMASEKGRMSSERGMPGRTERATPERSLHERQRNLPEKTNTPNKNISEKSFSERGNIKYSSTRKSASARELLGLTTKNYEQRFPAMNKLVLNGTVAVSQKVANGDQYRAEPLRAQPLSKEKQDAALRERVDPLIKCQERVDGVILKNPQRASIAEGTPREAPPPLQPRQMRINQSMRARMSENRPAGIALRMSPPKDDKLKDGRPLGYTMSQSKASYLASRRERERIVPDSDTGSYKRTISPNGHVITSEPFAEQARINNTRETVWPTKETILKNNNNANLLRRASMNDKPMKIEDKDDFKKPQLVLPDVLPVNAKLMPRYISRPTQLSLAPEEARKSPPKSPPSFRPLKKAQMSHSAPTTPSDLVESRTSPPAIRPALSPGSPKKTSPVRRISPLSTVSTPLKTSPLTSPEASPPQSPKEGECPKVLEGLQLIQRTEVVLRVNACTTDASSQTEKEEMPPTPLPTRRKLQEEIECEKLSEDFVSQLPPTSERLKDILVQGPDHKKPTDYVSGLFRLEVTSRPRPANSPFRSRTTTPSSSPPPTSNTTTLSTTKSSDSMTVTTVVPTLEPASPLSATSPYFTTSEPKARFLTRYSQDMNHLNVVKDTKDLNQKKDELVSRLDRKLEVLREEQLVVIEECRINDELGENVECHVSQLARPHEAAKFRLHVEEVGKITSLLLGLSGRLARAANALMTMPEDHPERRILEGKRDKLQEQLEEAKKLKESIDRRSVSVANILYKYLNSEEYADYDHFINMKAKLIMDSKEISDKIKLGEEQLLALKETLIVP